MHSQRAGSLMCKYFNAYSLVEIILHSVLIELDEFFPKEPILRRSEVNWWSVYSLPFGHSLANAGPDSLDIRRTSR